MKMCGGKICPRYMLQPKPAPNPGPRENPDLLSYTVCALSKKKKKKKNRRLCTSDINYINLRAICIID